MAECEVVGCEVEVKKQGFTLCYPHWTAKRDGLLSPCASCGKLKEGDKPLCYPCFKKKVSGSQAAEGAAPAPRSSGEMLSATDLGEVFGVSAQRLNLVVSELGWVSKQHKGWKPTSQGLRIGALEREARQSGIPYVVWPADVVQNKALIAALREAPVAGSVESVPAPSVVTAAGLATPITEPGPFVPEDANFRDRYSVGAYCAQDGHRVRSRAELLVDDWLYHHRIVHAYERKLPIDEPVVCDFWLPESRVYIEYWGMEQSPEYAARKKEKKRIYEKNEMNLVELGDQELKSLEDHLPRLLRKFGVEID